jgi:putative PIN family toxin of toxin-antitoxin system
VRQIVLDTNLLVSGVLSPSNAPGRIIDALRTEQIQLVIDDRIFLEYGEVLRRPKFERFIRSEEREWILDYIFNSALRVTSMYHFADLPDPYDACFLEVAATAKVPLITGNLKHFPKDKRREVEVLSPAALIG